MHLYKTVTLCVAHNYLKYQVVISIRLSKRCLAQYSYSYNQCGTQKYDEEVYQYIPIYNIAVMVSLPPRRLPVHTYQVGRGDNT